MPTSWRRLWSDSRADGLSAPRDDRIRKRNPAALLRSDVGVAAPPVGRVLRDPLDAEAGAGDRGQHLAQRPRSGVLPGLVGLRDGQAVDVFRRPAFRGLRPGEIVVLGRDPVAVLVGVEEPFDRMALEQDEPAGRREQPMEDRRPGVQVLEPDERSATGVEEIGRAVELVRRVQDVGLDPAGRRADRFGQPLGRVRASAD